MPTLEWMGKEKVINHHQQVPFRVLERRYSYDQTGQHDEDNGSENMIIRDDNLEALKALLPRYEGRVKCIYIDLPYNTGNEGWVYNDNVNDPKIKKVALSKEDAANYKNPDGDPRGPWFSSDFTAQGYRPNQMYEII